MPTFDYSGIAGGMDVHTCAARARIEDSEVKAESQLELAVEGRDSRGVGTPKT